MHPLNAKADAEGAAKAQAFKLLTDSAFKKLNEAEQAGYRLKKDAYDALYEPWLAWASRTLR